jgi:hypothetical protein
MLAFHSFILVKRCAVKTIPSFKKPSYWIFYIRIEHCQFEVKPTVPSEVFLDLDDNFEKYIPNFPLVLVSTHYVEFTVMQ